MKRTAGKNGGFFVLLLLFVSDASIIGLSVVYEGRGKI